MPHTVLAQDEMKIIIVPEKKKPDFINPLAHLIMSNL